jgi:hypothetical protein
LMRKAKIKGVLELKDVKRLLRAEIERAGGRGPWARAAGIDRTHVNRMLNGDRPISKKVIRALKLRLVFVPDLPVEKSPSGGRWGSRLSRV